MRRTLFNESRILLLLLSLFTVVGCASTPEMGPAVTPVSGALPPGIKKPSIIYIADFSLAPGMLEKHEMVKREGIAKKITGRFRHEDSPEDKAQKLIETLSKAVVSELSEAGQSASYVPGSHLEDCPSIAGGDPSGWLVNGWFVKVDEGNRAVEATVGFGTGGEHVDIQIAVSACATAKSGPFMVLGSSSGKKMMPGGIVTMNPYAIAIKFVLSKGATEKDVKKQGKAIAKTLLEQIKGIK